MKEFSRSLTRIIVVFLAFALLAPWAVNRLTAWIPGLPDVHLPSLSSLNPFKSEKLPPNVKVGEVRFVEFKPVAFVPDVYIKGEVGGIEASMKTRKRFQPDATSRAKLKNGQSITFDAWIGYDQRPGSPMPFYMRQNGGEVTLTIDPNQLVQAQDRVIPFENQDKISCNDDRWRRGIFEQGDCGSLMTGVFDIAIVGSKSCLGTAWEPIKSAIQQAEERRLKVQYEHYKQLFPKQNWQMPRLVVVFSPPAPDNWNILPEGWTRSSKDGRPVIQRQVKVNGKPMTQTIFTDQLKCKVDEGALSSEFYDAAGKVPGL